MPFVPLNVGFGNQINADKIIIVLSPNSAPVRRMITVAKEEGRLVDATYGRKTRSVILMENGNVALVSIQPETVADRSKMPETNLNIRKKDDDDV